MGFDLDLSAIHAVLFAQPAKHALAPPLQMLREETHEPQSTSQVLVCTDLETKTEVAAWQEEKVEARWIDVPRGSTCDGLRRNECAEVDVLLERLQDLRV